MTNGGTVFAPPLYWWKHMLQIKKSVSISNRAGAAVFAAPITSHDAMFLRKVLAHFSSENNKQDLRISSFCVAIRQ
jgi:hypothetical protein